MHPTRASGFHTRVSILFLRRNNNVQIVNNCQVMPPCGELLLGGCLLAAALKEQGIVPDIGLGLIFVSDEETGNACGIQHLLREKPDFVSPGDLVVVPDSGSPDGRFIEIAEQSKAAIFQRGGAVFVLPLESGNEVIDQL